MNYPFIPLMPLVHEVQEDLKRIVRTSSFSEDDCYGWAVDCLRLIGGNNYEPTFCKLHVKRYSAKLPPDFYALVEIVQCTHSACSTCLHEQTGGRCPITQTQGLIPADKATMLLCSRKNHRRPQNYVGTYTLKSPPGIARFSFAEGSVIMEYECLRKDEQGVVMIQDEIHGILAVKNYVKQQLLQERWVLGEVAHHVYTTFQQAFETHLQKAQMKQKFPDAAETARKAHDQDHRYSKFNYKNQ
jgi:hypothetical protein